MLLKSDLLIAFVFLPNKCAELLQKIGDIFTKLKLRHSNSKSGLREMITAFSLTCKWHT